MGKKHSKMKVNKEIRDEKMFRVGLGVDKGELRLEGNFQFGFVRKTDKKYYGGTTRTQEEEKQQHAPLETIPEEEEAE